MSCAGLNSRVNRAELSSCPFGHLPVRNLSGVKLSVVFLQKRGKGGLLKRLQDFF